MAWDAGAITGSLKLDFSEYTKSMVESESLMQAFPAALLEFMENPLIALAEVAKETADKIVESFKEALAFIRETAIEVGNAAADASLAAEKAGVGIGFMGRMAAAAQTVNVSAEQLGMGFKFLNQRAAEAVEGTKEAVDGFARLGITQQWLKDNLNNTEAIVTRVQSAIGSLGSSAEKTRASMALMGRAGDSLVPFFNLAPDAVKRIADTMEELGAIESEHSANVGRKFKELETYIGGAWEGIKRALAEPILDALVENMGPILDLVKELSASLREVLGTSMKAIVQEFLSQGPAIAQILRDAVEMVVQIARVAVPFLQAVIPLVTSLARILADTIVPMLKLAADLLQPIAEANHAISQLFGDQLNATAAGAEAAPGGGFGVGPGGITKLGDTFNVNVTSNFDPHETASQIADRIEPKLREQYFQTMAEVDRVTEHAAVGRAMGGKNPKHYQSGF